MALKKTAIAIPESLLLAVDQAAQTRQESRNRFINLVLAEAVRARRDSEITARLNALFAEPAVAREQRKSAADADRAGTSWTDERW